jgi:hypothetical protein
MRSKLNEITHHGSRHPNHATSNVVRGQARLNGSWTGRSSEQSEKMVGGGTRHLCSER